MEFKIIFSAEEIKQLERLGCAQKTSEINYALKLNKKEGAANERFNKN